MMKYYISSNPSQLSVVECRDFKTGTGHANNHSTSTSECRNSTKGIDLKNSSQTRSLKRHHLVLQVLVNSNSGQKWEKNLVDQLGTPLFQWFSSWWG